MPGETEPSPRPFNWVGHQLPLVEASKSPWVNGKVACKVLYKVQSWGGGRNTCAHS